MARLATKPRQAMALEQRIWKAADAPRGNQEPSHSKLVVLGLIFLNCISERFEEHCRAIRITLSTARFDGCIPLTKHDYPDAQAGEAIELVLERFATRETA